MCGFVDTIVEGVSDAFDVTSSAGGAGGGFGLVGSLLGAVVGSMLMGGGQRQSDTSAAQRQAQANADRAYQQADEAENRANAKFPNVRNLMSENIQAALGGSNSTMLTGSQGVDPASLLLGRNTLLGQ